MRRVLIINGHPDPSGDRLCAALARACHAGAHGAGHEVRTLSVGRLQAAAIRTREEFEGAPLSEAVVAAQESIRWCNHLILIFPLWQGGAPAILKAFLEQTFRYGFALPAPGSGGGPRGLLGGRSSRLIVTMGMPALIYRFVFGAAGVRAVAQGLLWLSGLRPARHTLLGGVETASAERRAAWLRKAEVLGRRAA